AVGSDALMLADKMFPKGATLRIAEPFMKVFRDGNRGVRVDSPHDLRVEPRVSSGKESREAGRQRGNALFGAGQFQAALTAYWQALRCCEDVAVLFSNRAQAYLKQEHWLEALRDSSAGLLLQPRNAKHWQRYAGALAGAGWPRLSVASAAVSASGLEGADLPDVAEVRQVLRKALSLTAHRPDGTGETAGSFEALNRATRPTGPNATPRQWPSTLMLWMPTLMPRRWRNCSATWRCARFGPACCMMQWPRQAPACG
ncbi:unnamed protein product, partial [Effrenium voratum]